MEGGRERGKKGGIMNEISCTETNENTDSSKGVREVQKLLTFR